MKKNFMAMGIFIFLTCLFTFPVIIKIDKVIYGWQEFTGDPLGTLWWIWWYAYSWGKGLPVGHVPIVGYPFGIDFGNKAIAPLLDYPVAGLNYLIGNEIVTYNITVLLGIFLTAFCMYFLVKYLTKSNIAGVLSGIIFGFCPNQLMHSAQHLNFTLNFWIPLFVLSLFVLKDYPSLKNALVCAFTGACMTLTNYYYGYFMLIFYVGFFVYWLMDRRQGIRYMFLAGPILVFMVIPFIAQFVFTRMGNTSYAHPAGDLFKYSAYWYDYFVSSEFHPIFGKYVKGLGRHYFERSLYLGLMPLLLTIIAFAKVKKPVIKFFIITTIVYFAFSLSPVFNVCSIKLPNVSYVMYKILPMFRVYARMGFLVIFSIAILAGYGFTYILGKLKSKWGRVSFSFICISFILFEYLIIPPFHSVDLAKTPEVYNWLAGQPENTIVVEYPFARRIEERHNAYLFYQRIHKKKMLNGYDEGSLGDAARQQCLYLQNPETAKLLAYLGAEYVIVHKDGYSEDKLKEISAAKGLDFVKDFPEAVVYKITAGPDEITKIFWENIGSWEKWDDESYWRWMGNNATIYIGREEKSKVKSQKLKVRMEFNVLAFAKPRELEIYVNDVLVKKVSIKSVQSNSTPAQRVVVDNVCLYTVENITCPALSSERAVIKFYTPQGEDKIGDVLKNGDNRRVCFAISDFEIS